jgi:serine/threonine-protein kinase HipA
MLAAIDGHAKNFSLFLLPGGAYRLTPRYDILSAYPILGHGRGKLAPEKIRMAMAVAGKSRHYRWKEIHTRHWIETARRQGLGDMEQIISDVIVRTPAALNRLRNLVPTEFPMQIADAITSGIETCVEQLKSELSG